MLAATDRLDFVPPPAPGLVRALALAVLAHAFLLAALTWGVHWKREAATLSVEAELWSALPQEAAPQALEVALPVAPEPVTAAPPTPVPEPVPVPAEPAKVDIAIEQEKLRLKKLKEKELLEKKRLQEKEKEKQQKERQAAEEKKKVELEKQRKQALQAKQEAQRIEAQRSDNLKRIAGLAGASGAPDAKGTALRSSGPSGSYAGRISARIKPNIVFTEEIAGNPVADVEVRSAPNGTILSRKLIKSSGLKAWDDAVLKAIDKTEKLPPDTDGQVPAAMIIGFRPKD
jgi:colicin import membrane protein